MKLFQNHLIVSILFTISCYVYAEQAEFSDSQIPLSYPSISLDEQISLMDAEILLLKAELAMQNGELISVSNYLLELSVVEMILRRTMLERLNTLRNQYALSKKESSLVAQDTVDFKADLSSVVVLLPQTGKYGDIGNAIVDGIDSQFSGHYFSENVRYFDTNLYDSMHELWELVKLYNPSFVIGPLSKEKTKELNRLNINVPTLYLNDIDDANYYTRNLSLNRTNHLDSLVDYIIKNDDKNISILYDSSSSSINLKKQFLLKWKKRINQDEEELNPPLLFLQVNNSIDKTMEKLLNAKESQIRKNWLQRTIGVTLQHKERVRKDTDVIISFLPSVLSGQVQPMLQYFHLNFVEHIWLPSKLPFSEFFSKKVSYWQDTTAFLPYYFVEHIKNNNKNKNKKVTGITQDNEQLGTFYALGQLVVKTIDKVSNLDTSAIQSKLGTVNFDENYQIMIKPSIVWIHKGRINIQD